MEERTRKILEFLEPYGFGERRNIGHLLNEMFPWTDKHNPITMEKAREVREFLTGLLDEGMIKMKDRPDANLGTGNISQGFIWLDTTPIGVSIGSKGLEMLSREKAKETDNEIVKSNLLTNASILRLNAITEDNIKFEKKVQISTVIVGLLTLIFIAISAIDAALDTTQLSLKNIETKQDNLNKSIQYIGTYLREINSSIENKKTDTVFVKTIK